MAEQEMELDTEEVVVEVHHIVHQDTQVQQHQEQRKRRKRG